MLKKGLFFLLLCITLPSFAQTLLPNLLPIYAPSQMSVISKRGYIRVGIWAQSYPPFVIYHGNGDVEGIDIALARKIADLLGVKVVFDKADTYTELMQNAFDKKDDIILSAVVSIPSRARSLDFSNPYLRSPVGILVNRVKYDNLRKNINVLFNTSSVKIGVIRASAYIGIIEFMYPKATIEIYDEADQLMADVTDGKLDGCMMDDLFVKAWLAQQPERAIRTRYLTLPGYYAGYGIATSYSYPVLATWLNNFVQEAQFIGFMDELLAKYSRINKPKN